MKTLYVISCLAVTVMLSQARNIPSNMKRYVGTGLFLGNMNGLSPDNSYSDSEVGSTTPDVNDATLETSTLETSTEAAPTIILSTDDTTISSDGTRSADVTTIFSVVKNDFETLRGDMVNSEVEEAASTGILAPTIATVDVEGGFKAMKSSSLTGDKTVSVSKTTSDNVNQDSGLDGIAAADGLTEIDSPTITTDVEPDVEPDVVVNVDLNGEASTGVRVTTVATADAGGLGVIDSSTVTTDVDPDVVVNVDLNGEVASGTTIATADVEGEFKATASSSLNGDEAVSVMENTDGLDDTIIGDGLGANIESGNAVNGEIKGEVFTGIRVTTIATSDVESSSLTEANTVSVTENFGGDNNQLSGLGETTTGGDLGAISSSIITTDGSANVVNSEINGDAFTEIRETTMATADVEGDFRSTASSLLTGDVTVSDTEIAVGDMNQLSGIEETTTSGDLGAIGSSVITTDGSDNVVNGEINGDVFTEIRDTTIATAGVEGEFRSTASSFLTGDVTVSDTEIAVSDMNQLSGIEETSTSGDLGAIGSSVITTDGSDNVVNGDINGDVFNEIRATTQATAGVEGEFKTETSAFSGDSTVSDTGNTGGDQLSGLGEVTTAGDLGAIGSSVITTDIDQDVAVNGEINGFASAGILGTTIATSDVEGEFKTETSSSLTGDNSVSVTENTGGDIDQLSGLHGGNLETDGRPGDMINGGIQDDASTGILGTTIATSELQSEFNTMGSSLTEDNSVSVAKNAGGELSSDGNFGSKVSSASSGTLSQGKVFETESEIAGNGRLSSGGKLESKLSAVNSLEPTADEKFIDKTAALNVYKLEPLNKATAEATKGKEAVLIYELDTVNVKRQSEAV